MDIYVIIMAGGVGSRFWPRSREKKPKQLIKIFGDNTMIQDTFNRLEGLVDNDKVFIVTNKVQKLKLKEQLSQIPEENIIDEPFGKNTAACIGLASIIIKKKNPNAITLVLPADHYIRDKEKFQETIMQGAAYADKSGGLVTIGITPTRPETGYGYIQYDEDFVDENIHKVQTFAEKPNLSTAKRFVQSGDFLWNSGMFIWKVDSILREIKEIMPDLSHGLDEISEKIDTIDYDKTLTNVYGQLKSISIDYGIMEKSKKVFLTKGEFDWSDVGSWETVYDLSEKDENGNAKVGDVYTTNSYNSYVVSHNKFTALVGVENLIVINTKDSLLVCSRDHAQDVKLVVDYLRMNNMNELT
ncbi:MAG: NTP transferase domain-containing protein [Bacteroidetes bacterium]|nr:NTP transferase domain-containing protein [Bacteroidota bacterium]